MATTSISDRRSALARARGLGAARHGVGHWWHQRLTALALIPLGVWFAASVIRLVGADYETTLAWISHPVVAILLVCLILATFHHAASGMQVVVEDYVHHHGLRIAVILAIKAVLFVLAVAALLAIGSIAFGIVRL